MTATRNDVSCPKCGGEMWDNRLDKKNPKAPDYKCKNRACDGAIWPPKKVQMTGELGYGAGAIPERSAPRAPVQDNTPREHNIGGPLPWEADERDAAFAHYDRCFAHAIGLSVKANAAGIEATLAAVSSIAATLFIATKDKV